MSTTTEILNYQNNQIRPVSKERQLRNARESIERIIADPSELDWMLQARRDFGTGHGYGSYRDWWDVQVATYPALFEGDDAIVMPAFVQDVPEPEKLPSPAIVRGRIMAARFAGHCKLCSGAIAEGQPIDYVKGEGAYHPTGDARCQVSVPNQERQLHGLPMVADERVTIDEEDEVLVFLRDYQGTSNFLNDLKDKVISGRELSPRQREAVQRNLDEKPRETRARITEDGMYRTPEGEIYKVQIAHHGSGNLYAKHLVQDGETWSFEYETGAVSKLTPDMRMSLDEAKAFGALYGVCCVCGRILTDDSEGGSIEAGIGPVCAGKSEWA